MISPLFWRLTVALTIKEIENAKPKAKKYKMLDGGGLSLPPLQVDWHDPLAISADIDISQL